MKNNSNQINIQLYLPKITNKHILDNLTKSIPIINKQNKNNKILLTEGTNQTKSSRNKNIKQKLSQIDILNDEIMRKSIKKQKKLKLEKKTINRLIMNNDNIKISYGHFDVIKKIKSGIGFEDPLRKNEIFLLTKDRFIKDVYENENQVKNNYNLYMKNNFGNNKNINTSIYKEFNLNTLISNNNSFKYIKKESIDINTIQKINDNLLFIDNKDNKILHKIQLNKSHEYNIGNDIESISIGNKKFNFKNSLFSNHESEILNGNELICIAENYDLNKDNSQKHKMKISKEITKLTKSEEISQTNNNNQSQADIINTTYEDKNNNTTHTKNTSLLMNKHEIINKYKYYKPTNYNKIKKRKLKNEIENEFSTLIDINKRISVLHNKAINEFNNKFDYNKIKDHLNDSIYSHFEREDSKSNHFDSVDMSNKKLQKRNSTYTRKDSVAYKGMIIEQKELHNIKMFL